MVTYVTSYPRSDAGLRAWSGIYVPRLARDLVGIDELDFDLTFLNYVIDARLRGAAATTAVLAVGALRSHGALSYGVIRGGRAGHLFVLPRSDGGPQADRDSRTAARIDVKRP